VWTVIPPQFSLDNPENSEHFGANRKATAPTEKNIRPASFGKVFHDVWMEHQFHIGYITKCHPACQQ